MGEREREREREERLGIQERDAFAVISLVGAGLGPSTKKNQTKKEPRWPWKGAAERWMNNNQKRERKREREREEAPDWLPVNGGPIGWRWRRVWLGTFRGPPPGNQSKRSDLHRSM